jgi:hypothetical protein
VLNRMVLRDPEKRPTSDEVIAIFAAELDYQMEDVLSCFNKFPF